MLWGAICGAVLGFVLDLLDVDTVIINFLNMQSIGIASNIIYYAFWIALGGVLGFFASNK